MKWVFQKDLIYFYEINKNARIKKCTIITPTSQNLARLEKDLEEYLPSLLGTGKNTCSKDCSDKVKMLVPAYDPCLTCVTQ